MRHREKGGKLGRNASHRLATLRALSTALLKNKKIKTTLAKAKATRTFVEPLITRAKENTVHARRYIAREINDKKVVQELFGEIIEKIGGRPGGYTRIVKLGNRVGDSADMAILELVDYNEIVTKKKTKSRKDKKTEDKSEAAPETPAAGKPKEEDIQEAEVVEETETSDEIAEPAGSAAEAAEDELPEAEEPQEKPEKKSEKKKK